MGELKLYAVHCGVWFFIWLVLFIISDKQKEKDNMSDLSFLFTVLMCATASFAIQWGFK